MGMKSAVFYGKRDVRVEETPVPRIREDEVCIRVMACGVCGTDVHIYEGDKGCADTTPPTILGHEFSGVVEAVGAAVRSVRVGERVCVDPNDTCGGCACCREGLPHFCAHMTGIGTTVDGGFAQYCAVRAKQIHPLPEGASFDAGAMTEPVACCLHGIDLCEIRPGDAVAVIGGGMIGLIMVQLARLSGASRVALIEPVAAKREMGERLGASLALDPFACDVPAALAAVGFGRLSAVIECAGLPATVRQAIEIAGKRAVVMLFGLTKPDDEVAIRPFALFQREIAIKTSYINPFTQGRALALIASGRVDVQSMVAARLPLEALPDVLADPQRRAQGKVIIHPWGDCP